MTHRDAPDRSAPGVPHGASDGTRRAPDTPRGTLFDADTVALARLGGLRLRAAVRGRLRELASIKGVLSVVAIGLFVGFVAYALRGGGGLEPPQLAVRLARDETLLALGLLAACVLSVLTSRGPALHFGPAEMNLLFAAPVRRHALVLYKSVSYVTGAALSAALIVLLLPPAAAGRAQLFAAIVLTLLFVQLSSAFASMAILLLRRRWPPLAARAAPLLAALLGALALLAHVATSDASPSETLLVLPERFGDSAFGRVVLAPFALFAGLVLPAGSSSALALRIALALLVLGTMLAAIVRLDTHVQEEVSSASLAAHARWRAMLRSGSVWQRRVGPLRSRRAPRGAVGIAPLAWSQSLRLFRTVTPMVCWLFAIAFVGGALLGMFATAASLLDVAAMLFFALVFMLPKMLVFDFRGAPQDIELTKTLPLPAWAVCVGQLATPVLVVIALQWTMIGAALPFVDGDRAALLLALAVVLVPFDVLHYALENLVFLLAPRRLVPVGRMDFDFLGRTLLEFLAKCTVLALAAGLAFVAGVVSLSVAPDARALAVAATASALALQGALAVAALAFAYTRFDSSRHALG